MLYDENTLRRLKSALDSYSDAILMNRAVILLTLFGSTVFVNVDCDLHYASVELRGIGYTGEVVRRGQWPTV